jgi:Secretion system C-terminal sorting domain
VVIWTNPSTADVYSAVQSGIGFTDPVQLNPVGFNVSAFDWSGPEIASSGNNVFVVFKQVPEDTGGIFCVKSTDGGLSWGDTVRVNVGETLFSRMPAINLDGNGNPVIAYLREDMETMYSDWALSISTDGGTSFDPVISLTASVGDAVCDCCPASIAIQNDLIAVLYRNNEDNLRDIRAVISDDGGLNFDSFVDMDPLDWTINACPASGVQGYFSGDELACTWMSAASGDQRVYSSSYNTSTNSFVGNYLVEEVASNQAQNFPTLAGNDVIKGIVIEQFQSGQRELFFTLSENDFSEEIYLAITDQLDGNQLRPKMVFDGSSWHLVFTDNGADAVQYMKIELSSSIDTEFEKFGQLELYPNPALDEVKFVMNGKAEISIYNRLGMIVRNFVTTGNGVVEFKLNGLDAGIYTVQVLYDHHLQSAKLIVE